MFNRQQLVEFQKSVGTSPILSVYVDGTVTDPAEARNWRVEVNNAIKALRPAVASGTHDEREEFERTVGVLDSALASFSASVRAAGWVGFITSKGVKEAHELPVPVPTSAHWDFRPYVGPYIRALKEAEPFLVAVIDASQVALYRYAIGVAEHLDTIHAHHEAGRVAHMSAPPKLGFHAGTQGTAGHDVLQAEQLAGRDRMIAEAVKQLSTLAGRNAGIGVGGIPRVVSRLVQELEKVGRDRVIELPTLDIHASVPQIVEAAGIGASALRNADDVRVIGNVIDKAASGGLGVAGPERTQWALAQSCVEELFFSHQYLKEHPEETDGAVRAAIAQGASTEEVSTSAADLLDRNGGIAAQLRFRPAVAG